MCLTFPVVDIKCSDKNSLKKKGFILSHNCMLLSITARKPRQQELEADSKVHRQEQRENECCMLTVSLLSPPLCTLGNKAQGMLPPTEH